MTAQWRKPKNIGLVKRLRDVTERLNEILPQIIEAQAKAFEGMAKTAMAVNRKPKGNLDA